MEFATAYLVLAVAFGLFMAWGVGANDVSNAMGTTVGSGALTVRQAIIIAAIFEFAGAYLAGGEVTETIRRGMIDADLLSGQPELLVYGMLASLLASGVWLMVASYFGWPVSTTHSIVGAIVGFTVVGLGFGAVKWGKVAFIGLSWVFSPALSGIIAYLLFRSVQKFILHADKPLENAKRYVPIYMFLVGFVITSVTLTSGLKHIGLHITTGQSYLYAAGISLLTMIGGAWVIRRMRFDPASDRAFHHANVEKVFGVLMMLTACAMAFAHGSNDVANAVGPLAAAVSVVQSGGDIARQSAMPAWVLLLGGIGIVVGLATYGYKVMSTIGSGITELTPSRGFAATLAAAGTVVLASGTGLPISTTHTLVGGILGVGLARGIAALNLDVVRTIFLSWLVTLPAGAVLAIVFFFLLKLVFS